MDRPSAGAWPFPAQEIAAADAAERELQRREEARDMVSWTERHFYIGETESPIVLEPHQVAVLRYALTRNEDGRLPFNTIIY